LWSWLRFILVATDNLPRVPGKWASLRSRIRGGHDYLTVRVATAAQFLTLRLMPIGSTHMGCDDSDGPGHAPRYLDVRTIVRNPELIMKTMTTVMKWSLSIVAIGTMLYFLLFGFIAGLYCNRYNHGGAVEWDDVPRWLIIGLYPSSQIVWLCKYNMWSAQLVNNNGSLHIDGLITAFYLFDRKLF